MSHPTPVRAANHSRAESNASDWSASSWSFAHDMPPGAPAKIFLGLPGCRLFSLPARVRLIGVHAVMMCVVVTQADLHRHLVALSLSLPRHPAEPTVPLSFPFPTFSNRPGTKKLQPWAESQRLTHGVMLLYSVHYFLRTPPCESVDIITC